MTFKSPDTISDVTAAKRVSNNEAEIIEIALDILEEENGSIQKYIEIDDLNIHCQLIVEELKPLIKYIDFKLIQKNDLTKIESLNIIPISILSDAYSYHEKSTIKSKFRSKLSYNKANLVWDESVCGSKLIIEDNGCVVKAMNSGNKQNARTKIGFSDHGVYEWDVIIEVHSINSWIGICGSDDFDYEKWAGFQENAWVLGSNGSCYNNFIETIGYCTSFGKGDIITVHLDMNERTCAFSVNGKRHSTVSAWKNLPMKLYPVVSMSYPGRFRIKPH